MLDCYGSNQTLLDDIKYVNKIMNELPYVLGLKVITPPSLLPYYYGKVKEDDGVSAFVLLEGGHFTLHTFPFRQCYFVDIYADSYYDSSLIENYFLEKLPYKKNLSSSSIRDRSIRLYNTLPYNEDEDFGPHVLSQIDVNRKISMEEMYDFLEDLVVKIGMTPIIRPYVLKSTITNPRYMTGFIMIAESHITLHYDYKENVILADIFSCCPFDYSEITNIFEVFGKVSSYEVVPRGTKHYSKVALDEDTIKIASEKWKNNIYN